MKPILNLTIKRNWLEMIASGEKKEEYRAPRCAQLRDWIGKRNSWLIRYGSYHVGPNGIWKADPVAVYRAGYGMDSPSLAVEIKDAFPPITLGKRGVFAIEDHRFLTEPNHPEWGEPPTPHWTIVLGQVLKTGSYEECKRFVEEMK